MGDRFSRVFRGTGELESLGSVECCCVSDFSEFLGMGLSAWVRSCLDWNIEHQGAYAFRYSFGSGAGFGIMFASNGRCVE